MKYVCKVEEVRNECQDMVYIKKKADIKQKYIVEFMNLKCIKALGKGEELKAVIREARKKDEENHTKQYMTAVRDKFIEMFYQKIENEKKEREHFEDKF